VQVNRCGDATFELRGGEELVGTGCLDRLTAKPDQWRRNLSIIPAASVLPTT